MQAVKSVAIPMTSAASIPAASTAPASSNPAFGAPLSVTGGPWVLGETLFFSGGKVVSDYSWRDKLHGIRGQLYTSSDLQSDVQALLGLNVFTRVTPGVYEIPVGPVHAGIVKQTMRQLAV